MELNYEARFPRQMLPRYTLCARNAAAIGRQFLLRTITTQILQVSTGQVLPVLGLVRQCGTQASVEACIAIGERERGETRQQLPLLLTVRFYLET